MIPYIIHASILLGITIGFYWLLLRKETFYKLNRLILLASIGLSLVLPLITVPQQFSIHEAPKNYVSDAPSSYVNQPNNDASSLTTSLSTSIEDQHLVNGDVAFIEPVSENVIQKSMFSSMSLTKMLWYIYLGGVAIFFLAFLVQLCILLLRVVKFPSIKDGKYHIIELNDDQAPYSFLNCIFINPSKYNWETYSQILKHEKIHIEQVHFFDKFVAEALLISFWFNPFVWLYRTAITNNLEYLTDDSMLNKGTEKESYQMSLLEVSVPQYPLHLTTSYNHSFLKNRISMMNTKKSSASSTWKYLSILPLFLLTLTTINAVEEETVLFEQQTQVLDSSASNQGETIQELKENTSEQETLSFDLENVSNQNASNEVELEDSKELEAEHEKIVLHAEKETNNESVQSDGFIEKSREDKVETHFSKSNSLETSKVRPGEWKGKIEDDELCFRLNSSDESKGWTSYYSTCVATKKFTLDASKDNPDWVLSRDAGTLTLEGEFNGNRGSGQFDFEPNESFVSYLKGEGVSMRKDMDMFHLFMNDMNESYVRHLKKSGFKISKDGLISLSVHGIERVELDEYIKVFKDLGKRNLDLEDIVQYEIHGVSPEYVKQMQDLNLNIDADNIVQAKIHGVDPDFVKELNDLGYNNMDMEEMVQFSIHGVDAELVQELKNAGYGNLRADEIVQFAIHGVSPEYIEELKELNIKNLSTDEIVQFAIHGIDLDDVSVYRKEGYTDISANDIVQMGIHGVDGEYVRKLRSLGLGHISVNDIVQFSIHGVDVSEVESFMKAGYDLDANDVVQMSIHGVDPDLAKEFEKQGFTNLDAGDLVQASIHGVDVDFVSEVKELGVSIRDFNDIISANIHGVSPKFIKKAQKKGYNLKTLSEYTKVKIHGFD